MHFKFDLKISALCLVYAIVFIRGVEQLLERISNGVLADDRRAAMNELRDAVTDNQTAQTALGAMGVFWREAVM